MIKIETGLIGAYNKSNDVIRVMLDLNTEEVWYDKFSSTQSWKQYNDNVMTISSKNSLSNDKITKAEIIEVCEIVLDVYKKNNNNFDVAGAACCDYWDKKRRLRK